MTPFDLIIFDCDGTLVDSEYLHNKVIADLLAALGLPQFTVEYNMRTLMGKGMEEAVALIEAEGGQKLPPGFAVDYVRQVNERAPGELQVIAGVPETLARLRRDGVKMCVASNGERENVLGLLRAAHLDTVFADNVIFTKSQVARAKPAPDLFLYAAAQTGAVPSRTLVIEDSVTGATAGIAAGMTVIGLTAAAHDRAAQGAALRDVGVHHLADRFDDIVTFIEQSREKLRA